MSFSDQVGNQKVVAALRGAMAENRLPHALLFAGPEGVGKRTLALTLAKALNCSRADGDACGRCRSCSKTDREEHPDVLSLRPSTAQIKVGEIRELNAAIQYRPFEGRRRIFLIDPADAMNEQAQNALLKTLEEPPADAFLILLSERPNLLLPTVRSRCQRFTFSPLAQADVVQLLKPKLTKSEEEIELLARLSQGRVGVALDLDLADYSRVREECLGLLAALAEPLKVKGLLDLAAAWGRLLEREAMLERLRILKSLLADLARLAIVHDRAVFTHEDIADRLRAMSTGWTIQRVYRFSARLDSIERALQRNVNRQLALEYAGLTLDE